MSLDGQAKLSTMLPIIAEALSDLLEEHAGEKVLFVLHIFGEGNDRRAQYVSNAKRADVKEALEELLKLWKERGDRDDGPTTSSGSRIENRGRTSNGRPRLQPMMPRLHARMLVRLQPTPTTSSGTTA